MFDLDAIRVRLDGHGWQDPWCPGRADGVLWADGGTATYVGRDGGRLTWADPLDALGWMTAGGGRPSFGQRWIGYLGYDLGRRFERLPSAPPDDLGLPLFVCSLHGPTDPSPLPPPTPPKPTTATANFTRPAYEAAVARGIEYIRAGDVFQVNLSQRFAVPIADDPWTVYARLAPTAYAACLDYGPFAVVSHSPELFLRQWGAIVTTSPIKGTRPNLAGMADQLLRSEKDAAELHMIVDLERNDLGRVCTTGTVHVSQPRSVEPHGTVLHGVATVEGTLRSDVTWVDLLRATFPGGSVTGAPKVRAMQVIDELEPVSRGPYCGAVGWVDGPRSQLNVAIRTMAIKDGVAHVPVGGGIVADSDPAAEYDETLVKATAMFAALGVAS